MASVHSLFFKRKHYQESETSKSDIYCLSTDEVRSEMRVLSSVPMWSLDDLSMYRGQRSRSNEAKKHLTLPFLNIYNVLNSMFTV